MMSIAQARQSLASIQRLKSGRLKPARGSGFVAGEMMHDFSIWYSKNFTKAVTDIEIGLKKVGFPDANIMTYYLNIQSQIKTLSFALVVMSSIIIFSIFEFNKLGSHSAIPIVVTSALILLPVLILYIWYLSLSFGKRITVDRFENKIYVEANGMSESFELSEIEKIIKVCSFPIAENRIRWMPTDSFFYFKILFKDGQNIIITSLMADKDFSIYGFEIAVKKKLIAI
jgi:hypothetical protein